MKTKSKVQYIAPAMQEVEVKTNCSLCTGSQDSAPAWIVDGDSMGSSTDWGRGSYGGAIEIN